MKKLLFGIFLLIGAFILSGCGGASPRALNGKYYMAGDSNCERYRVMSESRVSTAELNSASFRKKYYE